MAAPTNWRVYDSFKELMADGTLDLDGDSFSVALYTSTSNASTLTTSDETAVTNEVAAGNGYTAGGVAVTSPTWTQSGSTTRFDGSDPAWTATGGSITARYALLYDTTPATDKVVAYCILDSAPADVVVNATNTLTIQIATGGYFDLGGATT